MLPFGGFFIHFDLAGLNLQPGAGILWQLMLFCRGVASAKIESSPVEESGTQGCQLRGFPPKMQGILKACRE
jgi:hypothetical protein